LHNSGIFADTAYNPPLHLQPVFREFYGTMEGMLPISEDLLNRHLCLPCHQKMKIDDADYIITKLLEILESKS